VRCDRGGNLIFEGVHVRLALKSDHFYQATEPLFKER
jgi:hypothetical protein